MNGLNILLFMILAVVCSSCATHPTLLFDEEPLNDSSSKFTITSDLDQWTAFAGSVELGCQLAKITVDRGHRYYHMDQKSRGSEANRRPGFRLTFYDTLPEGMSVANPMTAIVYKGERADGYANGHGTMFYPDGARYEGTWLQGKPHGSGVMITRYGDRYEGSWLHGNEHGSGTMTYANGNRYEGDWHDGHRHGYGTMAYDNGVSYEGEWENGNITGHGIFTTREGERHEGDFVHGVGSTSRGIYITPHYLGIEYFRKDYKSHMESAVQDAANELSNAAIDAKVEGFLDLCREVRSRISRQ